MLVLIVPVVALFVLVVVLYFVREILTILIPLKIANIIVGLAALVAFVWWLQRYTPIHVF